MGEMSVFLWFLYARDVHGYPTAFVTSDAPPDETIRDAARRLCGVSPAIARMT